MNQSKCPVPREQQPTNEFIELSKYKILNVSLEWSFDPLCDPHAKAIDFDSLVNFDEAPLLTKGIAWKGFSADLIKLLYSGFPAHIRTLPFLSVITAWILWIDSIFDPLIKVACKGGLLEV